MQANLWQFKGGKEGKKYKKMNISRTKRAEMNEIEHFRRALIWRKNQK